MKIKETARFRKSYDALGKTVQKQLKKQVGLFVKDKFHPSLNTEKLEPKRENIWSMRVNKGFRLVFTFLDKEVVLFLDVGPYDIYRRK